MCTSSLSHRTERLEVSLAFGVLVTYTVSVRPSHWVCSCSLNYKVSSSFLPLPLPSSLPHLSFCVSECWWGPPWASGLTFSLLFFFVRASLGFYHFIKFFSESLLSFCSSALLCLVTSSSPSVFWIAHRLISMLRTQSSTICHLPLPFPFWLVSVLTSFRAPGHINSWPYNACESVPGHMQERAFLATSTVSSAMHVRAFLVTCKSERSWSHPQLALQCTRQHFWSHSQSALQCLWDLTVLLRLRLSW